MVFLLLMLLWWALPIMFSMNFRVYAKNPVHRAVQAEWIAQAFIGFWNNFKVLCELDWSILNICAQNLWQSGK